MNSFSTIDSSGKIHKLEIYTDLLLVQGTVKAPYNRMSDLLNRAETEFLAVDNATITPIGQSPSTKVIEGPVMVGRSSIHFAVEDLTENPQPPLKQGSTGELYGREAFVRKNSYPCYALTGTYVIYGTCYLHQDATLESLLRGAASFIPMTNATIYMMTHTNVPWKREFVIVNRKVLAAIYLDQQP